MRTAPPPKNRRNRKPAKRRGASGRARKTGPVIVFRETSARPAEIPGIFASWAGRSKTAAAVIAAQKKNAGANPTQPKREPWRMQPWCASPNTVPGLPPPDPNLRPTPDYIVFPWQANPTPIEWAVTNFLQKEHPEIHEKLIELAIEHIYTEHGQEPPRPPKPAGEHPEVTPSP